MKPCKHLDYDEARYGEAATLVTNTTFRDYVVRWWERKPPFGDGDKVQFCKLRGRIKGVFQCYNPGEMHCYEPEAEGSEGR